MLASQPTCSSLHSPAPVLRRRVHRIVHGVRLGAGRDRAPRLRLRLAPRGWRRIAGRRRRQAVGVAPPWRHLAPRRRGRRHAWHRAVPPRLRCIGAAPRRRLTLQCFMMRVNMYIYTLNIYICVEGRTQYVYVYVHTYIYMSTHLPTSYAQPMSPHLICAALRRTHAAALRI